MARVELTDDAKDDIRGLDGSVKARVLKDLQKLNTSAADRGEPLGSRSSGNLTGLRKLPVGVTECPGDVRQKFSQLSPGVTLAVERYRP